MAQLRCERREFKPKRGLCFLASFFTDGLEGWATGGELHLEDTMHCMCMYILSLGAQSSHSFSFPLLVSWRGQEAEVEVGGEPPV